jgi:hypothetical protein
MVVSILIFVELVTINSARYRTAYYQLMSIGKSVARGLMESRAFPRDSGSVDINQQIGQPDRWHDLLDVEQLINKYGRADDFSSDGTPKYYNDANIWTVIKNLPNDPPEKLIVMATRNVDASSLRTKLTYRDMHTHIRFRQKRDDLWILRESAVFIYANGLARTFRIRSRDGVTYGSIYNNQPFDVTTNLVNGLQVKYLTPDGEVIPTND